MFEQQFRDVLMEERVLEDLLPIKRSLSGPYEPWKDSDPRWSLRWGTERASQLFRLADDSRNRPVSMATISALSAFEERSAIALESARSAEENTK